MVSFNADLSSSTFITASQYFKKNSKIKSRSLKIVETETDFEIEIDFCHFFLKKKLIPVF